MLIQISVKTKLLKDHLHGMLNMPWGLVLLPELWLTGLPAPPEDSLRVPWDGGLLTPVVPKPGVSFGGAERVSAWFIGFDSL